MTALPPLRIPQPPDRAAPDAAGVPEHVETFAPTHLPKRLRLIGILSASLCLLVVVITFAEIDVYAVAPAKIGIVGRSKTVQSVTGGRMLSLHVANGSHVHAGNLLIELDADIVTADYDSALSQFDAIDAEVARRTATRAAVSASGVTVSAPAILFDPKVSAAARIREEMVYQAELSKLRTALDSLDAASLENQAMRESLTATIGVQSRLVESASKRLEMWESVLSKGLASKTDVFSAQEGVERERSVLTNLQGQLRVSKAAAETIRRNRSDALAAFVADNSIALANALTKRETLRQTYSKAATQLGYTRLVAPITGTVQEVSITTVGQVISPGQKLLTIVPDDASLEVEAFVANGDIGFVVAGQRATIKVDAFPYSLYGTVTGKVSHVARDAVTRQEAVLSASGFSSPNSQVSSSFDTLNLVYPISVVLDRDYVGRRGRRIPLAAGMTASVEIQTGRRRIISYILAPLHDTIREAGHER